MSVKVGVRDYVAVMPPITPWSVRPVGYTVIDVPNDDEARRAFRRRLGANLARIRRQLTRYSQEDVADHLSIDAETYGRIERGQREAKAYDLSRIADLLGIPAEWLLDPTDSFDELEQRVATLRRAAAEAARADVEEGPDQASDGGTAVPPGRR